MNIIKKGFTLIELLVVIGILAVLMAGVIALIDPVEKNRQALDSRAQAIVANAATASQSFAAQNNGCYANSWATLNTAGELKTTAPPTMPAYYTLTFTGVGNANCTNPRFDEMLICGRLQSKKYTGYTYFVFDSATATTCPKVSCSGATVACMP